MIGKTNAVAGGGAKTPVYTIIYDKSQWSDPAGCLTYAGLCEGFTPMSNPNNGNCDEGSWEQGKGTIFDAIEVGYIDGTTWVAQDKSAIAGSTSHNCFTRIPKIYHSAVQKMDGIHLNLSLTPFVGGDLHPAFIVDGVEKDYIYIGRYRGYNNSSKLTSISGRQPSRANCTNMRTYAKNNGTGYYQRNYFDWDIVNKLGLLAFKTFNIKSMLGSGKYGVTGGTNGKSWMYGTSDSSSKLSFLGLEDWWGIGHTTSYQREWIDDCYKTANNEFPQYAIMAGCNSTPTEDINNKCIVAVSSGGWRGFQTTCTGDLLGFFIGDGINSGTYTINLDKGLCSKQDPFNGNGMATGYSDGDGLNAFSLNSQTFTESSYTSARLTYKP